MSKTVNPNHQDELGYTPLHYAALNGHRYINLGRNLIAEFVTAGKLLACALLSLSLIECRMRLFHTCFDPKSLGYKLEIFSWLSLSLLLFEQCFFYSFFYLFDFFYLLMTESSKLMFY